MLCYDARDMGEMADLLLEQMWDEDGGGCTSYDDIVYEEETDSYYGPERHRRPPTCRYCSKKNLLWMKIKERWFLHEQDGNIHDCPKNPLSLTLLKELAAGKTKSMEPALTGTPFENYTPPSWDEWFIKIMYLVASKSKDPKTKIGAVLVRDRRIISTGYNGFCQGVNDNVSARWERPTKYSWVSHAERNSVYSAARTGIATLGTTMYTNGTPCTDCAKAVIQAGVAKVIVHRPYEELLYGVGVKNKWADHNAITLAMFNEAGVVVEVYEKPVGGIAYFDGKTYNV